MMKTRRVEIYQPESHLHQGVASTTAVPGPLSHMTSYEFKHKGIPQMNEMIL